MVESNPGSWPAGLLSHQKGKRRGICELFRASQWWVCSAEIEFLLNNLPQLLSANAIILPTHPLSLLISALVNTKWQLARLTLHAKLQLHYYVWDLFSPQFNINRVICRVLNWITNLLNDYFTSFVWIQINIYHFFQSNVYANVIHLLLLFVLHLDPCSEDIIVT